MKTYRELVVSTIGLIVGLIGLATILGELSEDLRAWRYTTLLAYVVFAGGIIYFAFKGTGASRGWRLLSLGILYVLTIPFFLWVGGWGEMAGSLTTNPCQEYGIQITEPPNGYMLANGQVTIRGTTTKRTPDRSLQLIGVAAGQYWPHDVDVMEVTETSWRGQSFGEGNYTAIIAFVGANGRILFDYFQKSGEISSNFPGIDELPDDVIECDSVFIP